jgi:hypothetical protein
VSEETAVVPETVVPVASETSETPVVAPTPVEVASTPEVIAPSAPAELPELRYEYQPKDEQGRFLGGKQVILYRTPDELADKLRDQNVSLVRKLREVTRKQRLGISDEAPIPGDMPKLPPVMQVKDVQPLSVEDRYSLSQDLNSPEKFEDARDKLVDTAPAVVELRKQIQKLQYTAREHEARVQAQIFIEQTPSLQGNLRENMQTIVDWMVKNGLDPIQQNFEYAYSQTKEAGLLLESPIVREEIPPPAPALQPTAVVPSAPAVESTVPNSQAPAAEPARISEPAQPQAKSQSHIPSGLNSRVASNIGVSLPATGTLTLDDIERMPSDEYKRRLLTDKQFNQKVNELLSKIPPTPVRMR